jgi:hypothetical protein
MPGFLLARLGADQIGVAEADTCGRCAPMGIQRRRSGKVLPLKFRNDGMVI